ncbi:O-antigen ligase family protein [Virgibacillus sp. MSP4-1]|uniref:O-antigen ligase family protein n=1 Tax=Virgibacillus sp. MSP4-1 TaxID=2700081 RepID=UPI0003A3076E|nr:O-antigen ligase family protein [Virgibacillus sp. MSP4-1]QHS23524.1 O-antigen ligase family protein [Virgibacillus sp. MSP4-1]
MSNQNQTIKLHPVVQVVLFCLLILNFLHLTKYDPLFNVGLSSINITLALLCGTLVYYVLWNRLSINGPVRNIMITFIILSFFQTISYVINIDDNSMQELLRLLLYFGLILTFILIKWDSESLTKFGHFLSVLVLLILIDWVSSGYQTHLFKGSLLRHPNALAVLLFTFLYFQILSIRFTVGFQRVYFIYTLMVNLLLIYSTGSRSIFLSIFLVFISALLLKYIKKFYRLFFLILISFSLVFFYLFVKLSDMKIGHTLNSISLNLLDKPLFNGRQKVWSQIWPHVTESPLVGHGVEVDGRQFTNPVFTAHNQYLQMALEVGVLGLAVFLVLLFLIWKLLIISADKNFAANLSISFFVAILIYENFELTLFQNNYEIGMMQWLVITSGIYFNQSSYRKKQKSI